MERSVRFGDGRWFGWGVNRLEHVLMRAKETDDLTKRENWTFAESRCSDDFVDGGCGRRFSRKPSRRAMRIAAASRQRTGSPPIGHGGLFKTPGVAEKVLSDMLGIPVTTRETAGEGGSWGIAKLAAMLCK